MSAEADRRQELFNYMSDEHDVLLLENELNEIIRIVGQHALSKKLEALTDERIEEMAKKEHSSYLGQWDFINAAKAILKELKK